MVTVVDVCSAAAERSVTTNSPAAMISVKKKPFIRTSTRCVRTLPAYNGKSYRSSLRCLQPAIRDVAAHELAQVGRSDESEVWCWMPGGPAAGSLALRHFRFLGHPEALAKPNRFSGWRLTFDSVDPLASVVRLMEHSG
jgi:hypothetical protein